MDGILQCGENSSMTLPLFEIGVCQIESIQMDTAEDSLDTFQGVRILISKMRIPNTISLSPCVIQKDFLSKLIPSVLGHM
jgi:hypothetical protein